MRWLIDGYNVMHAGGKIKPRSASQAGRGAFERARRRFVDHLAGLIGTPGEHETTVVFDASKRPSDFGLDSSYLGIRVVFALGDENADARIEQFIDADKNPRTLTVVSSDNRIRSAAERRKCVSMRSVPFWEYLDNLAEQAEKKKRLERLAAAAAKAGTRSSAPAMSVDDTALWIETFREAVEAPEIQKAFAANAVLLTDAEIAEIERAVEREG